MQRCFGLRQPCPRAGPRAGCRLCRPAGGRGTGRRRSIRHGILARLVNRHGLALGVGASELLLAQVLADRGQAFLERLQLSADLADSGGWLLRWTSPPPSSQGGALPLPPARRQRHASSIHGSMNETPHWRRRARSGAMANASRSSASASSVWPRSRASVPTSPRATASHQAEPICTAESQRLLRRTARRRPGRPLQKRASPTRPRTGRCASGPQVTGNGQRLSQRRDASRPADSLRPRKETTYIRTSGLSASSSASVSASRRAARRSPGRRAST